MDDVTKGPVSRDDIRAAAAAIAGHVRRTPILRASAADFGLPPGGLSFKLEFLQHTGSFKARGAFTGLLTRPVPKAGVVAASGGNHGAAVAFAAGRLGHRARIFVPSVAAQAKLDRIRSYGAELTIAGDRYADALAAAEACVAETGALSLHAYEDRSTMAGQGTVALEFEADAQPDTVLVAVGGGGLIGGMAAWLRGGARVVAVEPETAPTLHHALAAGEPVDAPAGGIAADSLAPKRIGTPNFALARRWVADSLLVPDEAILAAQKALWETLRVAVEPGGATAFAALLCGAYHPEPGEHVGVLLCGANTGAVSFPTSVPA